MGLFLTQHGHFQGWLAALLCCCAAVGEDESSPQEKLDISRPTPARNTVWDEQPTPLKPMLSSPAHAHTSPYNNNNAIQSAFDRHDLVRPISARPPSIKPLDFGDSSRVGRMFRHGKRKSSITLMKRISRPTDFRRLEYTEKQCISLKPLQLVPVVLRGEGTPHLLNHGEYLGLESSPLPEYSMSENNDRHSYRAARGTPWERCQQLAASAPSSSPTAIVSDRDQVVMAPPEKPKSKRPTLSAQSSSSSIQSLRRQGMDSGVPGTSTPSRPSSREKTRLKRKRSHQKVTGGTADLDIDKEILELNTIVEERRAEAARPQSQAHQHVPAIAPSMAVRARSETLIDIGSAFSRPRTAPATSSPAHEASDQLAPQAIPPTRPVKSRLSRPFMSMPDPTLVQEDQQQHIRRPSSRITSWLSNLLSSSPQTTSAFANPSPERVLVSSGDRATSEASICTIRTDLDSSATKTTTTTTTASSPDLSRDHSRSVTAESRITTPNLPPWTADEMLEERARKVESGEPHPSQVGLAL